MASSVPRRFAPLAGAAAAAEGGRPKLQGVVFDMDGTLCMMAHDGEQWAEQQTSNLVATLCNEHTYVAVRTSHNTTLTPRHIPAHNLPSSPEQADTAVQTSEPQTHMFGEMRAALGIDKGVDILRHIHGLPAADQPAAMDAIRAVERRAMEQQVPQPGLARLMAYLDARGVRKTICTRNFDIPVHGFLGKFLAGSVFDPIVTRDFHPPKPDPAGILHIARSWGLVDAGTGEPDASGLIMVGDMIDDMTAGRKAGAATVLLVNDVNRAIADHAHTDLVIDKLDDLVAILEEGFEGREID
ncbi:had superfamily [Purpureocillium lavendulum]|uniref:Had superfamily n=1 Tax=Purpureocillium lavendulum TaxID=1247861 RepID=A0AB34FXH2_9HYPO|nr:had superfamily [Purpureocillium lavendulum]